MQHLVAQLGPAAGRPGRGTETATDEAEERPVGRGLLIFGRELDYSRGFRPFVEPDERARRTGEVFHFASAGRRRRRYRCGMDGTDGGETGC
jgi:hypothetical protein